MTTANRLAFAKAYVYNMLFYLNYLPLGVNFFTLNCIDGSSKAVRTLKEVKGW